MLKKVLVFLVLGFVVWFFFKPVLRGVFQSAYPVPVVRNFSFNPSLILDHEAAAVVSNEGVGGNVALIIKQGKRRWTYISYMRSNEQKSFNLPLPGANSNDIQITVIAKDFASEEDLHNSRQAPN
jgi:hypothetical protein